MLEGIKIYSMKIHLLKFILLLFIVDITICGCWYIGFKTYLFYSHLIILVVWYNYGKGKLHDLIKKYDSEIFKKYNLSGKYLMWESNLFRAAIKTKDSYIINILKKIIQLNLINLLLLPNMIIIFKLIKLCS